MRNLACVNEGGVVAPTLADAFGSVDGLVFLALAAAAVASPIVRSRYRARVARLMALEQVSPRPEAWWRRVVRKEDRAVVAVPTTTASATAELRARAAQVERRLTRATLVAWATFAVFAAAIAGVLGRSQSFVMRIADGAVAALFAVGPVLANLPWRWSRRALALGAVALAAGAVLGTAIDPSGLDSPSEIAIGAAVLAAIYVALLHGSLRGQVLPVFIVSLGAMLVLFVPVLLFEGQLRACDAIGETAAPRALLVAVLLLPALWVGFRALAGVLWLASAAGSATSRCRASSPSALAPSPGSPAHRRSKPAASPRASSRSRCCGSPSPGSRTRSRSAGVRPSRQRRNS